MSRVLSIYRSKCFSGDSPRIHFLKLTGARNQKAWEYGVSLSCRHWIQEGKWRAGINQRNCSWPAAMFLRNSLMCSYIAARRSWRRGISCLGLQRVFTWEEMRDCPASFRTAACMICARGIRVPYTHWKIRAKWTAGCRCAVRDMTGQLTAGSISYAEDSGYTP